MSKKTARKYNVRGMSIDVMTDGKLLKGKGYGFASLELEAPATALTV
jgi:CubicO group peptidase (beta-lactamase class C family)